MKIDIRNLEQYDLSFLRDMVYESAFVPEGQKPFPRTIVEEPSVSKFFDSWGERDGDIGLIAEIDGQQIGAIWLRLFKENQQCNCDNETPEIGMAILKGFLGHGIGNALICVIEKQAINYGYKNLSLNVDPRNPARRLYERLGYVHVGWDDTYWTMEKKLAFPH